MNAADPEKVKEKDKAEHGTRKREINDIRNVLASASGRRFIWRLLERANVFSSAVSDNPTWMATVVGKQDFGHFILAEITEADQESFFTMMRESRQESDKETNP